MCFKQKKSAKTKMATRRATIKKMQIKTEK